MSDQLSMDVVEMPLDEYAAREGIRGRRRRGRGQRQGKQGRGNGAKTPVTSTQQRRKSSDQHNERSKNHRDERKSRRLFENLDKPQYSSVVFGNGTPVKVLTGRLNESQIPNKGKDSAPVSLVQAALDRGRKLYLEKQARSRGSKDVGGKRQSLPRTPRKRPVIQPPLSRKLRIVRPSDPGYKRQVRQLRDRSYSVRLIRNGQSTRPQTQGRRIRKPSPSRTQQRDNAPAERLLGPQSRRVALGLSRNAGSSATGPLSDRFSSLK